MSERFYTFEEQMLINNIKSNLPHICYYCNKMLTDKDIVTVDHKTPISRGGLTTKENLVLACTDCNSEKDNMTEEEYYEYKNKQSEIQSNFEVNNVLNNLIALQKSIINRIEEVKVESTQVERQIKYIQEEMMKYNFNASEGYFYARQLKDLLNKRNELTFLTSKYNLLKGNICSQNEQTNNIANKVSKEVHNYNKQIIKKQVMNKPVATVKKKRTNVIELKNVVNN